MQSCMIFFQRDKFLSKAPATRKKSCSSKRTEQIVILLGCGAVFNP
jgi:hypothetical protein